MNTTNYKELYEKETGLTEALLLKISHLLKNDIKIVRFENLPEKMQTDDMIKDLESVGIRVIK